MQFGNEAKGSGNMDEDYVISNGTCVSSLVFHHRLCFPTPPGLYYFLSSSFLSLSLSLSL
jgi:hypothetical protein